MCGIVGLIAKTEAGNSWRKFIPAAQSALARRGPDANNQFEDDNLIFGHCRLSIIDLSESANQPMIDDEFVIIFNGEIFNYQELKKNMEDMDGLSFQTSSDTEVILKLYRKHGIKMLSMLNGFFGMAIYDRRKKTCLIARDRYGVKPMFYYQDDERLVFASEMKALMEFPVKRELDHESLYEYLQLNYVPAPATILREVKKLFPGHYIFFEEKEFSISKWYDWQFEINNQMKINNYDEAKGKLFELLDDAVHLRLIADVPLGSFLSGGIDSSIICGLASHHTQHLKTFSIGYEEHNFFDETKYAKLVSKRFNTDHTVFSLKRNDLLEILDDVLNYFDEPFGDSSALPVYFLSKQTRKHVKVALSGDGADEIFGGYIKHTAEFRARNPRIMERMVSAAAPLWQILPKSRNSQWGNRVRQLDRFASAMKLNDKDRYWQWCCTSTEEKATALLNQKPDKSIFAERKKQLTSFACSMKGMNGVLFNDAHLVLPNDMLTKVDSMSMANGLEVRTPFLDYRVAEFSFQIPDSFKLDGTHRKKIVHDAFKEFLPAELYNRPKRGFEIPLHSFLTKELKSKIDESASISFLEEQKIFDPKSIQQLQKQLFSGNPDDSAAQMWGFLVFQHWWKRWML